MNKEVPNKQKSEAFQKAKIIAELTKSKQASKITILDISNFSTLCDYFVICSGASSSQVRAIYDDVIKSSRKSGLRVKHFQGDSSCRWMLIDFFDVILHIFLDEAREFYNLEYLWRNAEKINLP